MKKLAKSVGVVLLVIGTILLIISVTIQPSLAGLAILMYWAGLILVTLAWFSDDIEKERKKAQEQEQTQQDHNALVALHQEQEAEIVLIFSHMQESTAQMCRYIDIYEKNINSKILDYLAETKESTPLLTSARRHSMRNDILERFVEDKTKLGMLMDARPLEFDFKKATHADYELFSDVKKMHHEKIKAQAERFFKSYEDFKRHTDAKLIGKLPKPSH